MESEIAPDAPLDCVKFQIYPQNRYDACICSGDKMEKVGCGLIDQLTVHLPQMKDLYHEGSHADLIFQLPQNLVDVTWFTKTTFMRFLHIVDSTDALKKAIAINNELSQLEETKIFHISLYAQGDNDNFRSGESDRCNSKDVAATLKAENVLLSSDDSKNELLRAMDLRLVALREELVSAFNLAARATYSSKEIVNLAKFCEHFAAVNLRNLLCKVSDLNQQGQAFDLLNIDKSSATSGSRNDYVSISGGDSQKLEPLQSVKPVRYGASPAKVAQIERESSTEGEDSSGSSGEDGPSAERSRTPVRLATPRRSASPLRRIQIGRSGSHRAPALTIKNIAYFPSRERTSFHRDAAPNDSQTEEPQQTIENPEYKVRKMSVQDAINLFESKQRDQTEDIQKRRSLTDNSANTQKVVLRRWSAGVGDSSSQCPTPSALEYTAPVNSSNSTEEDKANTTAEINLGVNLASRESEDVAAATAGGQLEICDKITSNSTESDIPECQAGETSERIDQDEWNQKKEEELNQMLVKLVESKPIKYQNKEPNSSKSRNPRPKQRGGFYDHYKERRDEKLRENSGKKAEKQAHFNAMQKILDKTKAELSSRNVSDDRKIHPVNKTQKVAKDVSQASRSTKESPKPGGLKKPKASSLPITRKSWPSTSSPRAVGTSPAKTPTRISSSGSSASRQKSQSSASISRPSPKVERSQQQKKDMKKTQVDTKKSLKNADNSVRHSVAKVGKTKTESLTAAQDNASTFPIKPGLRSRMTKKSSVVPLESKPSPHKASGGSPSNFPLVIKVEVSSRNEEPVSKCENPVSIQEDEVAATVSDLVSHQVDGFQTAQENDNADSEQETQAEQHPSSGDNERSSEIPEVDETIGKIASFPVEIQPQEEQIISLASWVENGHQDLHIPICSSTSQSASPAHAAEMVPSGARVRQSLSQMLLEDICEHAVSEWGTAENPPMVYQKDAPKGLKRLLKFARKGRGEAIVTGSSSPSTSEGDGDFDECKIDTKRNNDIMLRRDALQGKKYGQQGYTSEAFERNFSDSEPLAGARRNTGISSPHGSNKFQQGHASSSAATKATRSFFSLPAFRGNK
ncbi:hypothetical protein Nepgr_021202 [Nepenthes gracilis]|uniref:COP1-interacting protein 7 n=1 Tax=Nepenthes gracilis TaxID=150966 RepID=A0AAD3SYN6_NEPGR|nr:hypothetical protein Nepgr_021202 [Nepenthes gracilis]